MRITTMLNAIKTGHEALNPRKTPKIQVQGQGDDDREVCRRDDSGHGQDADPIAQ
jgi:hypothetical protein